MALFGVDRGGTKGGGCEWVRKTAAGTPAPFSIVVLGDEDMKHKLIPCEEGVTTDKGYYRSVLYRALECKRNGLNTI